MTALVLAAVFGIGWITGAATIITLLFALLGLRDRGRDG